MSLMETEAAPDFEDGDVKEYNDSSENSTSSTVHDEEGKPKLGKNPLGDKISTFMAQQNGWANAVGNKHALY